jgi:hypothetical protein
MIPGEDHLERARAARRAGDILARAGEDGEAALAYGRARTAYALLLGDAPNLAEAGELGALDQHAELAVLGEAPARRRRARRVGSVVLAASCTAVYVAFALGARPFAGVSASAVFDDNPLFGPRMAVDGQAETEWLLPDRTSGSLELTVFPARDVRRVIIRNGHNRQFNDRAVRTFSVELLRDGVRVHVAHGMFGHIAPDGETKTIVLPQRLDGIDHVRFVVADSHGIGSALAEIRLE